MNKKVLVTASFLIISGGYAIASLFFPSKAKAENTTYVVYSINKAVIKEGNSVLNEEVKLEEDGDGTYEIPGDAEYVIIKQENGVVAVWTENPLSDPDQFRDDYIAIRIEIHLLRMMILLYLFMDLENMI